MTAGSKTGSLELWDQDAVCRAAATAGVVKLRPPPTVERRSAPCEPPPRAVLGTLLEVCLTAELDFAAPMLSFEQHSCKSCDHNAAVHRHPHAKQPES